MRWSLSGGTIITVDAVTPLAISTSLESGPESGPESNAPLLPSLDDFPTPREMLGLSDREFSREEVDDAGLKRLFWIPQTWKAHLVVLSPHLPPQSPASRLRACVICLHLRACVLCLRPEPASPTTAPEPRRPKRTLSIPGHYAVLAGRSPRKPRRSGNT